MYGGGELGAGVLVIVPAHTPFQLTTLLQHTSQGGDVRKTYHATCAVQPAHSFIPTIGVDRYRAPPLDSPPSAAATTGHEEQHRRPGGQGDGSVFVRLTEEDPRKRERKLAALIKVCVLLLAFMYLSLSWMDGWGRRWEKPRCC